MSIRRPVARGRAAEHPGAKGLAGGLPKWPECSVTLAGRLPGLSKTLVTLAGRLPGLSKTPVTLAGRLPGPSDTLVMVAGRLPESPNTPTMLAGGLPESPNTPTMLAGGLPDICGSHITARRAYKHEQIARHITPTDLPQKRWCTFFFDEEPHFCRIMRQGGRVTVANGTQGIRLNG